MPKGRPTKTITPPLIRFGWVVLLLGLFADHTPETSSPHRYQGLVWPTHGQTGPSPTAAQPRPTGESPNQRLSSFHTRFQNPQTGTIPQNIRAKEIAWANTFVAASAKTDRVSRGEFTIINRGPRNLGGRTRALGVDIRNDDIILAGGVSGGMWRTINRGRSWEAATRPDQIPSVTCLLQDPRDGNRDTWYYGSGEIFGNTASAPNAPFRGDGIFKSTDNGASWEQIPTTATTTRSADVPSVAFNHIHRLAIDPTNRLEDELYAAVPYGIIRTTDAFETFDFVLGGTTNFRDGRWTEVMATPSGRVYATLSNEFNSGFGATGIFTSTNGTVWQEITPETGYNAAYRRIVMAYAPSSENLVYFLGDTPTGPRLHQYNSNTNSWLDLTDQIPNLGPPVGNFNTQRSYNMVLAIHPTNPQVVLAGATNLYRSTNGFTNDDGTTWIGGYSLQNNFTPYSGHHPDQHALAFDNQNRLISGHDGGVSTTENPLATTVSWQSLNRGYGTVQTYAAALNTLDIGSAMRVAGMQDLGSHLTKRNTPETPWTSIGTGDGGICAITPNSIIVSWQYGQMYRYGFDPVTGLSDSQEVYLSVPNAPDTAKYEYVTPWVLDPTRPNRLFVASKEGLYYLDDITQSNITDSDWRLYSDSTLRGNISALAIPEHSPHLWLGTDRGYVYRVENNQQEQFIYKDRTTIKFPANGYISSIAVHPFNPDEVTVTFSNYGVVSIFRTTNSGETWEAISGNLEVYQNNENVGPGVTWISMIPQGSITHYFVGTTVGLFYTTELLGQNTTWDMVGAEEFGFVVIDRITANLVEGTVLIATHGKGVYELKIPSAIQPRVVALGTDPGCDRGSTLLVATRSASTNHLFEYQWLRNGDTIPNANQGTYLASQAGTYQAFMKTPSSLLLLNTPEIELKESVPSDMVLNRRRDTLFAAPACSGCQYEWLRDGEPLKLTTSPTLFIGNRRVEATYSVRVSNGCGVEETNTIVVDGFSIDEDVTDQVVVIPNPVEDFAELIVLKPTRPVIGARLYTTDGRLIEEKGDTEWRFWDLQTLGRGQYMIEIYGSDFRSSTLLIKR